MGRCAAMRLAPHSFNVSYTNMTYRINDKEVDNVLSLDGQERYKHFVKRVADWEEVWGLRNNDGWVTSENNEGEESIPFWPHPEYAHRCATGQWEGNQPTPIDLESFIEEWLPGLEGDAMLVAVFPTPEGKSVHVQPSVLLESLKEELTQYE